MAVVFADPFGSYISGLERGQQYELDYQEQAFNTFVDEMRLLDDLVLEPQRQLAREQRQYARQLDLMVQRNNLARQRQQEAQLLREGTQSPSNRRVVVNGDQLRPVLGGRAVISAPGSASINRASPLAAEYNLGVPR